MIVGDNKITIASITDGTSNTFMVGETAIGTLANDPTNSIGQQQSRWWQIGFWYSGEFDCEYPINAYKRLNYPSFPVGFVTAGDWTTAEGACSFHPGGCNFAFCDGSVKFIKETIASWGPYNPSTGDPSLHLRLDLRRELYRHRAGPQVYQKLATRNGGEVISSDSY